MRIAAILYIIASVTANFFIGNLSTFLLAALSFPLLLWLLLKKNAKKTVNEPQAKPAETNNPGTV